MLFYGSNSRLMACDRQIVMKQTRAANTHSSLRNPHICSGLCLTTTTHCLNDGLSREQRVRGQTLEDGEKRNSNDALFQWARSWNAYGWMMGGKICLTDFKSTGKAKNSWRMGRGTQKDGGRARKRKTQLLLTGPVWFGYCTNPLGLGLLVFKIFASTSWLKIRTSPLSRWSRCMGYHWCVFSSLRWAALWLALWSTSVGRSLSPRSPSGDEDGETGPHPEEQTTSWGVGVALWLEQGQSM